MGRLTHNGVVDIDGDAWVIRRITSGEFDCGTWATAPGAGHLNLGAGDVELGTSWCRSGV